VSIPSQNTFKDELQSVDPSAFEQFVADVWDARGWNTRVTRDSADRGVDVVATQQNPFRQKQIIQAKRYSDTNPVGSPEVQQYASLRQQEDADVVIIVTSGRFSKQATSVARDLNVKLVDGDDLHDIISLQGLSSITDEYLDIGDNHSSQSSSVETPTSSSQSEPIHTLPPTADADTTDTEPTNRTNFAFVMIGAAVAAITLIGGLLLIFSLL
jgi:Restriction endonuclease